MVGEEAIGPQELLSRAKQHGDLGPLLAYYRGYLKVIARLQIGTRLQGKADASDVVQETLLQVHRTFVAFRGSSEQEWLAWLRQTLANTLANLVRRYVHTQARDVRLEKQLHNEIENTSQCLAELVPCQQPSPSKIVMQREQAVILAILIEQLPHDYREVVILRHLQQASFPEIAQHMGRSVEGVKKLSAHTR